MFHSFRLTHYSFLPRYYQSYDLVEHTKRENCEISKISDEITKLKYIYILYEDLSFFLSLSYFRLADFNFDKPFSLHDRWPAAERAVAPIRSATVENGISEGQVVERAPYENLESPLNDKTVSD